MVGGLLIMWRGEDLISILQRMPNSFKEKIVLEASLQSLRGYPFSRPLAFFFVLLLMPALLPSLACLPLSVCLLSGLVDAQHFHFLGDAVKNFEPSETFINYYLLFFGLFSSYVTYIFMRVILVELMVPLFYRDLNTVRKLVEKCSTRKQFIRYVEAERTIEKRADLIELLQDAQAIITDADVKIIDRMIELLSVNSGSLHSINTEK